jgi:hypothetical protein
MRVRRILRRAAFRPTERERMEVTVRREEVPIVRAPDSSEASPGTEIGEEEIVVFP